MAKIEDLIAEIADARLREEVAREVAALKKQKKFGLVFEEHIPEQVQLPSLAVKPGLRVVKRDGSNKGVFIVEEVFGNGKTRIKPENGQGEGETVSTKDLVAVKRFGEPIYPTLVPVARVTRVEGKPYHTIINAENFHALQLLLYCYSGQVDVIYIDPPYNTGARDWKYNNDYVDANDQWRHSKWLAMMKRRLTLAGRLLQPDGVLICTVDDHELFHIGCLLEDLFPARKLFVVVIEHNKRGRQGEEFARTHEYALFVTPSQHNVIEEQRLGTTIGGETRNLRRTGNNSLRGARPKQFYPIYVDPATLRIVEVGKPLAKDARRHNQLLLNGAVPVWPLDKQRVERNWHYGPERTKRGIADGKIFAAKQEYGIQIYYTLRTKESTRWKTVWSKPSLDASTYGSEMLVDILGHPSGFSYPKSLYAVADCLLTTALSKKNAIVMDFFGGSGTTVHATALLNAEDGGNRRCILVTNNEVAEKEAKRLGEEGILPGDREFERHGVCEAVTWPRCKYATQGRRDDGTALPGMYLDGTEMKDGLNENLEYFRLDFLDPHEVAYGEKFEAILPILWLMAGAKGKLETARGYGKWFIPKESPYAVLIKEEHFAEFKRELQERSDITHVFLVTDSEEAFREMSADLPGRPQTRMLYKSYLDNFRINTEKLP